VYNIFVPGIHPKTSSCRLPYQRHSFVVILAHVTWPRADPLGQSILLKFSLETRLESESFEPLIDFLALLVQKL